jgi:hypothetical protein
MRISRFWGFKADLPIFLTRAAIVLKLPEQPEVRYRQVFTVVIAAGYGDVALIGNPAAELINTPRGDAA